MTPVSRRAFLATGAAGAAGLAIGFYLPHSSSAKRSSEEFSPNAYLRIGRDGKVTIVVARSEMGQGVRTALPMILAEELEADWKQIAIEQAPASNLFGDQTTGGSASVRSTWDPMRRAGAAAREMLISAAALEWGVPRSACTAENGSIVHAGSKRRLSYGELVDRAATLPVPTDPPLKAAKDYKIVGKSMPRLDVPAKVDGTAVFGIDFRVPGMKYAVLARCTTIGGKVNGFDDKESRKVPGVTYVGKVNDSAVAVVADNTWAAMEGRRVLNVNWEEGPNVALNSTAIFDGLRKSASDKPKSLYAAGDVAKTAGRRITAEYQAPFMAHAAMEPGNTTAHFHGSTCELWSPTQVPQDVRDSVAQALGIDADQVTVNVTLMGGGFGRRLEHDYGVEAALLAKQINAPVKVVWSREDDMRCSVYRPASHHQLTGVLDGRGFPVAFAHRIVMPSINTQKGFPMEDGVDSEIKEEASFIYGIPNLSIDYIMTETPVRLGWMRSVNALQVAFAAESFIDELAAAAGKDPLEFRLHQLSGEDDLNGWKPSRMRGVLQLAADKAGWGKAPAGHYQGIACFACFHTYAAEVVEISMENDKPRVHRVVAAVDCGQVVNPNILEQQLQGGVIYALTNALHAQITFDEGRVVQGNFDDYPPIRIDEAPVVEGYFVQSTESPTGIGEPSVPPLAPALCNAIYAATKKRIRSLPVMT